MQGHRRCPATSIVNFKHKPRHIPVLNKFDLILLLTLKKYWLENYLNSAVEGKVNAQ